VFQELNECKGLILAARDKIWEEGGIEGEVPGRDADRLNQLGAAYQGLLNPTIIQVSPSMTNEVRRVVNVRRVGTPILEAKMMPARSGYLFFETVWPAPIKGAKTIRSLTWTLTHIPTSNLGLVPAVQVNIIGPHYSSAYGDLLPLGSEYAEEWHKSRGYEMRQMGHLLWAVWQILGSEIAATQRIQVQHKDLPPKLRNIEHSDYRVVYLRHTAQDPDREPGHRDVNWQGRWTVDGHWRHLEKYEGRRHKAVPQHEDGKYYCLVCRDNGLPGLITHIGSYTKPKDRTDLPWLKSKRTIHKLVR
jgi:ribosomal protein S30